MILPTSCVTCRYGVLLETNMLCLHSTQLLKLWPKRSNFVSLDQSEGKEKKRPNTRGKCVKVQGIPNSLKQQSVLLYHKIQKAKNIYKDKPIRTARKYSEFERYFNVSMCVLNLAKHELEFHWLIRQTRQRGWVYLGSQTCSAVYFQFPPPP